MTLAATPSQTVGPVLRHRAALAGRPDVVAAGTPGAVGSRGRVIDGAGDPVADALRRDLAGRRRPAASPTRTTPRTAPAQASGGSGAVRPTPTGRWAVRTVKPGPLPGPDGAPQAPHLHVSVFARGLLDRLVTRIYFPDEADANAADPVLASSPTPRRRATLVAEADGGRGSASTSGCRASGRRSSLPSDAAAARAALRRVAAADAAS